MNRNDETLWQLVDLTRRLGDPGEDYVILGEGNTSAARDDGTIWVKASGVEMTRATDADFVVVRSADILAMLNDANLSDDAVRDRLLAAKVDGRLEPRPSVETLLHVVCLQLPGIAFVGHTHPTAVNSITCSKRFVEMLAGRLFPDEIVVCGQEPLLLPYVDPGLKLGLALRTAFDQFVARHGAPPKAVWMQNHGLVALGRSAREVDNITAMSVKTARILLATAGLGGPNYLAPADVQRIHTRTDEHYRQRKLDGRKP